MDEQQRCRDMATRLELAGVNVVRLDTTSMTLQEELTALRPVLSPLPKGVE